MSGIGILRIDGEEISIKKGDVISALAGKDSGHQFINISEEILQILDVGTREKDDVITYSDENIVYIKENVKSHYSRKIEFAIFFIKIVIQFDFVKNPI